MSAEGEHAPRSLLGRLGGWLARIEDGAILRACFFAMLAGTIGVLYIDYNELADAVPLPGTLPGLPALPAFDPDGTGGQPGPAVTTDAETLRAPARIGLATGGTLTITGTIDVGSAARFAEEVLARGEYVKSVALDSPGGSVSDALEIGELIREKGFATSVADGSLCASSCPLILAGGVERHAEDGSAIGVHQIYAAEPAEGIGRLSGRTAMADAQRTTARITRYLESMGIAAGMWMHALETPPDRLYYFSSEELVALKLVTKLGH